MKRNYDVARRILLAVQASEEVAGVLKESLESAGGEASVPEPDWLYGILLLSSGGYLSNSADGYVQLTWAGHDLLDKLDA